MSDTDRKKLADELREEVLAALAPVIDKLVDRVYPVTPAPENPSPEEPSPAPTGVSAPILVTSGTEWENGFSKQVQRFTIKSKDEVKKAFVLGATVQFADGNTRRITGVTESGNALFISYDGERLNPAKVGYPNVVIVMAEAAKPDESQTTPPIITPDPLPVDPTDPDIELPEPETPFQPFTLQINNYDGKPYWENGVWVMDGSANRVSVINTPKALDAFSVGSKAKLVDGLARTVLQCQDVGKDLSIVLSGPALDPAKVGYPFSLSSAPDDAEDDEVVEIPKPSPVEPAPAPVPDTGTAYRGIVAVNNGLGMGHEKVVPGTHMQHYRWPQLDEWKKARDSGFTRARVGGLWERMKLGGAGNGRGKLNTAEMDRMLTVCEFAKQVGMDIMWDLHNYSGYSATGTATNSIRKKIGSPEVPITALGDDWRLFLEYLCKESVFNDATYGYDIMNEPIIPWTTWKPAAQHTVNQIAAVSDKVVILEGINYSNTTNWVTNNPGMETITHPKGKQYLEFQGHLYLDKGQDGFWTNADETNGIVDVNIGLQRIAKFAAWGKQHGLKLGIGETMVPGIYPQYVAALDKMLAFCVEQGIDVYLFFTAYGAGNNWHNIYKPENAPTLKVIEKYAKRNRAA